MDKKKMNEMDLDRVTGGNNLPHLADDEEVEAELMVEEGDDTLGLKLAFTLKAIVRLKLCHDHKHYEIVRVVRIISKGAELKGFHEGLLVGKLLSTSDRKHLRLNKPLR